MKMLISFSLTVFILHSFAQENKSFVGIYTWRTPVWMQKCTANGDSLQGFEMSRSDQKFEIVKELSDDSVVIKVLYYGAAPKGDCINNVPYFAEEVKTTKSIKDDTIQIITTKIERSEDGAEKIDTEVKVYLLQDSLPEPLQNMGSNISIKKGVKKVSSSRYTFIPNSSFYKYNFSGTEEQFHSIPDGQRNAKNFGAYQIYFKVSKSMIKKYAYYKEGVSLAFGVINFPFKARFNPVTDFTGSFNFGTAVGLRFAKKSFSDWSFSIIAGQSISSLNLDQASVLKNASLLSDNNDFSALTLSLGPMIAYKNVQIGLFMGMDMLSRQNQSTFNWIYNKEPWFSIGLGYGIFSRDGEKKNNESQNVTKNG